MKTSWSLCQDLSIYQLMADNEGTPTCIEGVNYQIDGLMDISEQIKGDNTFLTLVNFWRTDGEMNGRFMYRTC